MYGYCIYIISTHPSLSPPTSPSFPPLPLKFITSSVISIDENFCIYKQDLMSPLSVPHMYVFRADHLTLDNLCSV